MFRFVVLAVVVTVVLSEDNKKCRRLFHPPAMHCCKSDMGPPKINKEELKECFDSPHKPPPSCDLDICIAKKRGYGSDDGTVDMDAFEKTITEDFEDAPTLVEAIKENCIKGDLSKYGPPDACKLAQLKMCIHKTMIMDCKEWDDDGPCAGMKDLVKECAKMDE
uniref:Odorant-binding protein OBP47 n=1 Tax=Lobesia botrana TaxID=209534 RepID=A0A345BES0_9NEOP|nr:odorant-binding protein OBP47 [Lobesia botrana]